jgi:uncharacterized protein YbcV (DUF1398 family)
LNANRTLEAAHAALAGALPFPEIVRQLIANGVEYYFVDFVSKSFTFYSAAGSVSVAPLSIEDLPTVASEFNAPALRAAILDSQQNGLKFRAFCRRAVEAGVQSFSPSCEDNVLSTSGAKATNTPSGFLARGPAAMPNPSIERTSSGRLRLPPAAAHVER